MKAACMGIYLAFEQNTPRKAGCWVFQLLCVSLCWKAGEGDRTLDIQLGKRKVPSRNRALRVSVGGHPMHLLHLLRVDA